MNTDDDQMEAPPPTPPSMPGPAANTDSNDDMQPETNEEMATKGETSRGEKRQRERAPRTPTHRAKGGMSDDESVAYSLFSPASPPAKVQTDETMHDDPADDAIPDVPGGVDPGDIGQLTKQVHTCNQCGSMHTSRNKPFKHKRGRSPCAWGVTPRREPSRPEDEACRDHQRRGEVEVLRIWHSCANIRRSNGLS